MVLAKKLNGCEVSGFGMTKFNEPICQCPVTMNLISHDDWALSMREIVKA